MFESVFSIYRKFQRLEQKPRYFGTDDYLYPAEIHTIVFIGNHPGTSAVEVVKGMEVTKGAVSQMLKKLVNKDLVQRKRMDGSSRRQALFLTEKGTLAYRYHNAMHRRLEEHLAAVIGDIDSRDRDRFLDICGKIVEDLDRAIETDWLP